MLISFRGDISNSYSNDKGILFDCQLISNQIKNYIPFLKDNLTNTQFRIFKAVMELTVKHRKGVFPSLSLIAKMAHCARSTVQEGIKKLKELNIIRTEYRGYHQTLMFQMHQFYFNKRDKLVSIVREISDMSLFFLLLSKPKKENRYLLKEKVDYLIAYTFSRDKKIMFELSDEQFQEVRKYPGWVYERCLLLYTKKEESGVSICSPASYFMGIFRQEAAKATPRSQEQSFMGTQVKQQFKKPTTEKTQPWVRPKDGPYSVYKPEERRVTESDFEMALKMRKTLKATPNVFLQLIYERKLQDLTEIENRRLEDMIP